MSTLRVQYRPAHCGRSRSSGGAPGAAQLARTRYVWLKNPRTWTAGQKAIFEALHPKHVGLRTAWAYHLKLALQEFWELSAALAEAFLRVVRPSDPQPAGR
ncbi:MAG: hypothetical protein GEU90_01815 [Gemmatimonas sp.]|nr:hypothetical protein [Gemmatimonas sp.]